MIPKKIHYCWFGKGPFSKLMQKCIESWKRFCPDYEIICWDESNSPLEANSYVYQAYQLKKWAFVSDYVRLYALNEYGGIYLDTDVELLQSFDMHLGHEAFWGFESTEAIATCVIGAIPHHALIQKIVNSYSERIFQLPNGSLDQTTNVVYITEMLANIGLCQNGSKQIVGGATIYPVEYFSPKDLRTGEVRVTPNTVAIHHFQASWMTPRQRLHTYIAQKIGQKNTKAIKQLLGQKL